MLFSLWVSEFFLKISSLNEVFPFFFPFLNCLSRVPFQWSFHSSLYSVVVSFVYMVVRFSFAGIWLAEIHKLKELMVHGLSLAPPLETLNFLNADSIGILLRSFPPTVQYYSMY